MINSLLGPVHHQIILLVAENVVQNKSFVMSKVTPASKVPPFYGIYVYIYILHDIDKCKTYVSIWPISISRDILYIQIMTSK